MDNNARKRPGRVARIPIKPTEPERVDIIRRQVSRYRALEEAMIGSTVFTPFCLATICALVCLFCLASCTSGEYGTLFASSSTVSNYSPDRSNLFDRE